MPLLYVCFSAYRPYLRKLEVLVLRVGQVGDQHGRLAFDQADQADRAAGDDVGDEQLLAVDDVIARPRIGASSAGRSGRSRRPARSARKPTAARRWPAWAGSAASARRCRTCAPDRRRRCSREPRPGPRRWDRSSPLRVRNGANARNGAPHAAVLLVDQQAPVADLGQLS